MYYGVDLGVTYTLTRIIWDSSLSAGDLPPGLDVQTPPTARHTPLSCPSGHIEPEHRRVLTIPLDSVKTRY